MQAKYIALPASLPAKQKTWNKNMIDITYVVRSLSHMTLKNFNNKK